MTAAASASAVPSSTRVGPLRVTDVTSEAEGVISIRLEHPDGRPLPYAAPGSHLDLRLPSGRIRQYSLCGDLDDRTSYRVAVLREDNGRGGSAELHSTPLVGAELEVLALRNHFPLVQGASYLLIAGGIGITPLLAMARQLARGEAEWRILYLGRTRTRMAFIEELSSLCGDRLEVRPDDESSPLDLADYLSQISPEASIYCCGPEGLLTAVEAACAAMEVPRALHSERFAPDSSKEPGGDAAPAEGDGRFTVHLKQQGIDLEVPPHRTLLDVVREVLPDVPFSCEEGYCGTCEAFIVAGVADHRDDILTPEEQARNQSMMICVSRSLTPRLELDL